MLDKYILQVSSMAKRKKIGKVPEWVKREREARRQIEIENGGKKDFSHIHKTDKKDIAEKESNTVRDYESDM